MMWKINEKKNAFHLLIQEKHLKETKEMNSISFVVACVIYLTHILRVEGLREQH